MYSDAVEEHGSERAAAIAMGIPRTTFKRRLQKEKALPYSLRINREIPPDGFEVKGVSTLYGPDGEVKQEWVKTTKEAEDQRRAMEIAAQELAKDLPRATPIKAPNYTHEELASCYVVTDYHLGQLSWSEEAGEDWDTEIAEDLLINWFKAAIETAPKSSVGVLCQLGDFLHWDGHAPITPTSGHVLDADTRFQKVVRVAIKVLRTITQEMLKKARARTHYNGRG
jgi:hypothetical protein